MCNSVYYYGIFHTCGDDGSFGELLDESESAGRPNLLRKRKSVFT